MNAEPLLSLEGVSVTFGSGRKAFHAVDGVSLDIMQGETLSLVGESGSGKTTVGRAIMRVQPLSAGSIRYRGERISGRIPAAAERRLRQRIQMIFQDPMASLNERAKIDYIVGEGLANFGRHGGEAGRRAKVGRAMEEVGLLPEFASRFPHEFSGGQRQRIGIARALVMEPELLVADEPISALDVSIRAQVINLLNRLKKDRGLSYLFIAHDLSVVRFISDRIAVIYRGRLVELAQAEELFARPLHPYTRALLSAVPVPDPDAERDRKTVAYDPSAHRYGDRRPSWAQALPGHFVSGTPDEIGTWLAGPGNAPT